jgi:hypothetical protein
LRLGYVIVVLRYISERLDMILVTCIARDTGVYCTSKSRSPPAAARAVQ